MQPHSGRGRRHRRFSRKYEVGIFVAFLALVAVALVALIMYGLTSTNWRVR